MSIFLLRPSISAGVHRCAEMILPERKSEVVGIQQPGHDTSKLLAPDLAPKPRLVEQPILICAWYQKSLPYLKKSSGLFDLAGTSATHSRPLNLTMLARIDHLCTCLQRLYEGQSPADGSEGSI